MGRQGESCGRGGVARWHGRAGGSVPADGSDPAGRAVAASRYPGMVTTRTRRLWTGGLVALCSVGLGGAGIVQHRTAAAWTAMQATAEALASRQAAERAPRVLLVGAAESSSGSGTAQQHYARALELAAEAMAATPDEPRLRLLPHHDEHRTAGTEALRAHWQPALAELRRGARSGTWSAAPPTDPGQARATNLLRARWLVNLAVLEARVLRQAGRDAEAVAWTLDAAAFGADLMRSQLLIDTMIGGAMVVIATAEAWPDAALRQLEPAALRSLADGLQRLDAQVPVQLELGGELQFAAAMLQQAGGTGTGHGSAAAWRYGFSSRWQLADGFLQYAAAVERLAGERALGWAQREAWLELELAALEARGNPVAQDMAGGLPAAERSLRTCVTHLRLLRSAIARYLGEGGEPFADPLGEGPLAMETLPDGVLLRSAGAQVGRPLERRVAR